MDQKMAKMTRKRNGQRTWMKKTAERMTDGRRSQRRRRWTEKASGRRQTVICFEITGDWRVEIDKDNLHMKFSALNLNSKSWVWPPTFTEYGVLHTSPPIHLLCLLSRCHHRHLLCHLSHYYLWPFVFSVMFSVHRLRSHCLRLSSSSVWLQAVFTVFLVCCSPFVVSFEFVVVHCGNYDTPVPLLYDIAWDRL